MHHFLKNVLQSIAREIGAMEDDTKLEIAAIRLVAAIGTKEFADLYRQRIGEASPSGFDLGAGDNINQLWSKTMTAFTDATSDYDGVAITIQPLPAIVSGSGSGLLQVMC